MKKLSLTVLAAALALGLVAPAHANPTQQQPKGNQYVSAVIPTMHVMGGTVLSGSAVQEILWTVSNNATSGPLEIAKAVIRLAPAETGTLAAGVSLTASTYAGLTSGAAINLSSTIPVNSFSHFQRVSAYESVDLGPFTLTAPGMSQNIYGVLLGPTQASASLSIDIWYFDPTKR